MEKLFNQILKNHCKENNENYTKDVILKAMRSVYDFQQAIIDNSELVIKKYEKYIRELEDGINKLKAES